MYPSGRKIIDAPEFFIGGADTPFKINNDFDGSNLRKKLTLVLNFFKLNMLLMKIY